MPISTSSLFHFTKKKATLERILRETFKIFYSLETIKVGKEMTHNAAYPMVSFCDIPLSSIKNHLDAYGHYGIGLRKEWGIQKRLNPVLYLESQSSLTENFFNSYNHLMNLPGDDVALKRAQLDLVEVLRYTKNFEGKLERKNRKPIERYRFSDEREWRYVPSFNEALGIVNGKEYPEQKDNLNRSIDHLRLSFEADDIKYIIIKREDEIGSILTKIGNIKGPIYSQVIVERVKSRVITAEQIFKDF